MTQEEIERRQREGKPAPACCVVESCNQPPSGERLRRRRTACKVIAGNVLPLTQSPTTGR